ncbi:hypothetical protein Hanom_Chr08g00719391 [Helianthus anomalus]
MGGAASSWMIGEVLLIILLSCLRAGGGRVPSKPWPQRLLSRWLARLPSLPLKKFASVFSDSYRLIVYEHGTPIVLSSFRSFFAFDIYSS